MNTDKHGYQTTAVPLTGIRHTGLDPVSSRPLKTWIPDQQKTLSGMTGLFFILMSHGFLGIHQVFINKASG